MTQKPDAAGKVRVMLMLDPDVAKSLRILAAMDGCRGVSEYITEVIARRSSPTQKFVTRVTNSEDDDVPVIGAPTYVEDHEDGTD